MPESSDEASALKGVGVLVTRPAHQAEPLARLIERAGGTAVRFPTIAIAPPAHPERLDAVLDRLSEFDLAVFVSPNAVTHTFARPGARSWPPHLATACVGKASARALEEHGVRAMVPAERYDSEALLALPALQQMAGQRVVIFRGDGGRELLADTLARRGATITYAECYRRVRPPGDAAALIERWRRGEIDIVTVTSSDGLRNLHDMLGEGGRDRLLDTPVVVLSAAQADACRRMGFASEPLLAPAASDQAILETIRAWRLGRFSL